MKQTVGLKSILDEARGDVKYPTIVSRWPNIIDIRKKKGQKEGAGEEL
jgi:hypothetical protein